MKKFIFFSLVLVFLFIVFILAIFFNNSGGLVKRNVMPTITPFLNPGEAVSTFSKPSKNELEDIKKYGKVGDLINLLPYTGSYFYLDFDFAKNTFVLTLDKNNIAKGNSNFDVFLKKNGIQDRSWFENLNIIYKQFTLAP
jgi:hypothetical protein